MGQPQTPRIRIGLLLMLLVPGRDGTAIPTGATPGGLVWSIPDREGARRVLLFDRLGALQAVHSLAPDEPGVLGVADDGSRVSAASPYPASRTEYGPSRREHSMQFGFRGADGRQTAIRGVSYWCGSEPVALGASIYFVRVEDGDWVLLRQDATGPPAVLARASREGLAPRIGHVSQGVIHASPAGVVLELLGTFRPAYLRADGILVVPLDCNPRLFEPIYPLGGGVARNRWDCRNDLGSICQHLATFEVLNADGSRGANVEIGPYDDLYPLPGGRLARIDHASLLVHGADGRLESRVPWTGAGLTREQAERETELIDRIRAARGKASGREYVDLALIHGSSTGTFSSALGADEAGALARLLEIRDGDPTEKAAARVLQHVSPPTVELLRRPGAPGWMRRTVALGLLNREREKAPDDARSIVVEALLRDQGLDLMGCACSGCLSPIDAERLLASDRARISKLVRERPDLVAAVLRGEGHSLSFIEAMVSGLPAADVESAAQAIRFHVSGGRFPREVLACVAGGGPAEITAAVSCLGEPYLRQLQEANRREAAVDGSTPESSDGAEVESVQRALIETHADLSDPAVQAVIQLMAPFYGIALDAGRWRSFVEPWPDLTPLAVGALVEDTSLPGEGWSRLLEAAIASARATSRDPGTCPMTFRWEIGGSRPDAYCRILVRLQGVAASQEHPRSAELHLFTGSSRAPAELPLAVSVGRLWGGRATEADALRVWRSRELPWRVRRAVLANAVAGGQVEAELLRDLASFGLARSEASETLDRLARLRPREASALAARAFKEGRLLPFESGSDVRSWAQALDLRSAGTDESLLRSLRVLLRDDLARLEVAYVLARLRDPAALPALEAGLRRGLLDSSWRRRSIDPRGFRAVRGDAAADDAAEIASLFGAYGGPGVAALERAALQIPESRGSALALRALLTLDHAAGLRVGRKRAAQPVGPGCRATKTCQTLAAEGVDLQTIRGCSAD